MPETLHSICEEFWDKIKESYIFYLEGFRALELLRDDVLKRQQDLIKQHAQSHPDYATIEYTDTALVPYIEELTDPTQPGVPPTYRNLIESTVADVKRRNVESGQNFALLGNMCLISIFSWWEEGFPGQPVAKLTPSELLRTAQAAADEPRIPGRR